MIIKLLDIIYPYPLHKRGHRHCKKCFTLGICRYCKIDKWRASYWTNWTKHALCCWNHKQKKRLASYKPGWIKKDDKKYPNHA